MAKRKKVESEPTPQGSARATHAAAGTPGLGSGPERMIARLEAVLRGIGLPVSGVAYVPNADGEPDAVVRLVNGTEEQETVARVVVAAFDWGEAAEADWQLAMAKR